MSLLEGCKGLRSVALYPPALSNHVHIPRLSLRPVTKRPVQPLLPFRARTASPLGMKFDDGSRRNVQQSDSRARLAGKWQRAKLGSAGERVSDPHLWLLRLCSSTVCRAQLPSGSPSQHAAHGSGKFGTPSCLRRSLSPLPTSAAHFRLLSRPRHSVRSLPAVALKPPSL